MITLTISHPDGSTYWVEYFNDMPSAQAWLADEQTRPYWNPEYTFQFVDSSQQQGS